MILITNIILIALSLSMDAFALALSYGMTKLKKSTIIITAVSVGIFHFIMPLIGNYIGTPLFIYTTLKPRYILFFLFFLLSLDMLISFFKEDDKKRKLNIIGTIIFSFSVSFDSLTVGLGLNYLSDSILMSCLTFCIISLLFTIIGFIIGKKISTKLDKYSYLIGSITLFLYSIFMLTK